jgi:hypothetical protein
VSKWKCLADSENLFIAATLLDRIKFTRAGSGNASRITEIPAFSSDTAANTMQSAKIAGYDNSLSHSLALTYLPILIKHAQQHSWNENGLFIVSNRGMD